MTATTHPHHRPWQPQGLSAQFHPILRDAEERIFLIHVTIEAQELTAALLVVDGYTPDGWVTVSDLPGLSGQQIAIQLPAEVTGQCDRCKAYDVVLPAKAG